MSTTTLLVNGAPHPSTARTVRDLLVERGLDPEMQGIAVALGNEVVPRSAWSTTALHDNDTVEIITAMAGG